MRPAQADTIQRRGECARLAAKAVMSFGDAVQTDADVIETDFGDAGDIGFINQRAVAGQGDVEPQVLGAAGDGVNIRAQQRLAARQNQHRHPEPLEIIHDRECFLGRQLAGEIGIGGDGVAMLAGQIAAPHQIPDHHRAGRIALGRQRRGPGDFLHELGDAEHK